jgi:hypothetical protein
VVLPVKGWCRNQTLPESADDQPSLSYTTSWDTTRAALQAREEVSAEFF